MARRNPRSDRCPWCRGSAFTLIELAVIVVVIVLLVSVVHPVLAALRSDSRLSVCLTRLGVLGTASKVYEADDPSGWAIPVHPQQFQQLSTSPIYIGAYEWGGKSGIGRPRFLTGSGNNPLNSKYGTRAGFGPATRPMNNILYPHGFRENLLPNGQVEREGATIDTALDLPAFRCPADNRPPEAAHCPDWVRNDHQSSYDHFGTSYAANIFMVGQGSGGCFLSNSPYLRPASRVPTPARTIFYEENIGRWAWASREDPCPWLRGVTLGPNKSIAGWHGKPWTFTRVFGDAHAETQRIFIEGTGDRDGYSAHYFNEQLAAYPPFLTSCGTAQTAEGDFNSYQCIIVRGQGWQKDTLPGAFIQTGLMWPGGINKTPAYEDCVQGD